MKKALLLNVLAILLASLNSLNGQTANTPEPIEFRKQKIYYQGKKVKKNKVKDLEAIIHPINDPTANGLLKDFKSIQIGSWIPLGASAGLGAYAAAVANQANTAQEIDRSSRMLSASLGLLLFGTIFNGIGWPTKGKKAVLRYNEVVGGKMETGVSLQLMPASGGLGLGARLSF